MSGIRGRTSAVNLNRAETSARIGLLLVDLSDHSRPGVRAKARRQTGARAQQNAERATTLPPTPSTRGGDALTQLDARFACADSAASDDDALAQVCAAVCDALGWDEARFWPSDPYAPAAHGASRADQDIALASIACATRAFAPLGAGVGVVAQVFATGEPACMLTTPGAAEEVDEKQGASRDGAAERFAAAQSAFAFPARGVSLVGVMECLSATPRLPDAALLKRAAALGARIGAFIERRRAKATAAAAAETQRRPPGSSRVRQASQPSQRQRAKRGQREGQRRVEEVLAVAAHDMRTPITASRGYIQMAASQLSQLAHDAITRAPVMSGRFEQMRRYLEEAEQSTRRLAQLVDYLLDVERLSAHKLELQPRVVDLAAIIRREVEEQRLALPDRVIHCDLEPTRVVPALADPEGVGQVLSNYLANALKYSPEASPVEVTLGVSDDEALISVRDQGLGIAREDQERIWLRFEQAPAARPRAYSPGLGLGLYICRSIVEALGGRVGVESVLGRGSTFWFGLPLA